MRFIRLNLSAVLRPVRFFFAACICALMFISYALPAYSANAMMSSPGSGEANLTGIERKSQEAVAGKNPSDFDIKKQEKETHPGLNEIQGAADYEKMKRPENTKGVTTPADQLENALEQITGRD
ncbi:MAG TPA: low temperature-induced protein [Cyanobacteria bacterium UBA11371]|nr:low temperature-induced protein [Cyanobacteria bacterium UBA11371]